MNGTSTGTAEAEPQTPDRRLQSEAPRYETRTAGGTSVTCRALTAKSEVLVQDSGGAPGAGPSVETETPVGTSRPHRALTGMAVTLLFGLALIGGFRWWQHARRWTTTDNAYVAAHIHTVSARVSGTVKEVLAQENQSVAMGAVLARLDARDFEVRRQQSLALVAQAQAQRQQAESQIAEARARVAQERAQSTKTRQDLERAKSLYHGASGAISKQELEQAQASDDAASAALLGAQSALESANALATAAQAQEKVAEANLRENELQLSYTEITAPVAGRIGRKNLEVGNRVQPGQALLALVQPDVWVTANFKETQLGQMQPGQLARVKIDAFPGRVFIGRVESLSPASGAQFALLPPDNATGNFTKIVQRVPVKIAFDGASLGDCVGRVVSGMSAYVEVRVGEKW